MNKLDVLKKYLDIQACDEGLWFISETVTEEYLQNALRRIVWMIEEASVEDIKSAIDDYKNKLEL